VPEQSQETPRTNALEARALRLEAKLEKIEALLYEERARQREQQIQIDGMQEDRNQLHTTIGRWIERIVFGALAAVGWFWDKVSGQ
jgi:hypothetical protein